MAGEDLFIRLGPDLKAVRDLTEWDHPRRVAVTEGPGDALGVWGMTAKSPRLGRFGRLLALEAAVGGEPVGAPYRVRPFWKLVTYVPESHLAAVRQALGDAGAGHIGQYTHCTFSARGEGTFLPLEGAAPFIGQPGRLEIVAEWRLETVVPHWLRDAVERRLIGAHPYEEVAYDWIPLGNALSQARCRAVGDEWWCDQLDAEIMRAAQSAPPSAIHCERADFRARLALRHAGVAVIVHPPGSFLLEGMERRWQQGTRLWR
ncbi:MAG: YqfO family protein [Firmicutes bacterium]|nr:hypothetical protein [Alicyclobacillaceae bacterium]MCL6496605.1 YqfO family protein [Bacillota bacterium]